MDVTGVLTKLEAMGDAKVRALTIRDGADDAQFGVKLGDIRALAQDPVILNAWLSAR